MFKAGLGHLYAFITGGQIKTSASGKLNSKVAAPLTIRIIGYDTVLLPGGICMYYIYARGRLVVHDHGRVCGEV